MERTFRYRLRPTARQQVLLTAMLADHCALYNAALQERRDAYRTRKVSVRYGDQSGQLKEIRKADREGQGRWSFTSQQQTLRRLDRAFQAFFRRVKAGETPGFPRFKSWRRFDTVTLVDGDGGRWREESSKAYVQGVGELKVRLHRSTRGRAKQFSVTRQGRHWYVNVMCVDVPRQIRPLTGAMVGLDKGAREDNLLADSDGGFVPNPRAYRTLEAKLAAAQRKVARCKRGSNRRRKAVAQLAAVHRRIARVRLDHLHQTSRQLVDTYDLIVTEELRVDQMTRSPQPKPDPQQPGSYLPNRATAKAGLNKTILDAGWGVLQQLIDYKAEEAGVQVVVVNPRDTSRTCHECDYVDAANRDGEAFHCLQCGHEAHADTNAARNILRRGHRLREAAA